MRQEGQFAIACRGPAASAATVAATVPSPPRRRPTSPPAETHTMRRPLRVRAALCAAALGLACLVGTFSAPRPAEAFPKPSIFPVAWQLKFNHSVPKRIVVQSEGTPRAYWYITFAVTNTGDEEQDFLPTFDLFTKDGKNLPAQKHVPGNVFDEIKKRERNRNLEPLERIAGKLRIGEDQTREGVAIWEEPSTRMA